MAKTKNDNRDWLAWGIILFFIIFFALLSFGRHDSLKSYLNDLGTYDQVVWNTASGHFFENSANMLEEPSYLGAHFSPILLLFVPLYKFWADPKWFLAIQALAIGLSGVPVYLLARRKLGDVWGARIILASYFLYPFLQNGALYDFHEVVMAVGFAAWAFYFLEREKYVLFIIFSILLALSQEHLVLLVLMMGLYIVWSKKRTQLGLVVAGISLAYFLLVMLAVIPHFSSGGESALIANSSPYPSRYAWLGGSFPEVLKNVAANPIKISQVLISPERLSYLFWLIAPVFSLALLSPAVLIIAPLVAINLLSSNSMTFSFYFYHSAILAPIIFMAATLGLDHWFGNNNFFKRMFLGLILAVSIYGAVMFSVSLFSFQYHLNDFLPDEHAQRIKEVEKIIPAQASLSVQHNLGPHFSERRSLYRFPLQADCVQFVVLDETDPYRSNPGQFFNFEYALQMPMGEWKADIQKLKNNLQFEKIYDQDGYLVFKNKKPCAALK